ncbi:MAG: metal-dependent hydrolase [Blastocatellia bacterium]|nr:metal-dependent hydrolase [Blastocatellia bacterium]
MPLPIAHGLIGASIVAASREDLSLRKDWHALTAGAALAILPDLDLFFSWVMGMGATVHGGFTHSLLFAVIAGSLLSMMLREVTVRGFLTYVMAAASHGLLDSATRREFGGAKLLWPISTEKFRLGLTDYFEFYPNTVEPIGPMLERALDICLYEMMIFMPLFILTVWCRRAQDTVKTRNPKAAFQRVVAHR